MGGGRKNRPGATATKLPIELEGKAGDRIARCSTVLRREAWGRRPTMADHGVWIGCSAGSAVDRRRGTWLRVGLTSATTVGDGKHRAISV